MIVIVCGCPQAHKAKTTSHEIHAVQLFLNTPSSLTVSTEEEVNDEEEETDRQTGRQADTQRERTNERMVY